MSATSTQGRHNGQEENKEARSINIRSSMRIKRTKKDMRVQLYVEILLQKIHSLQGNIMFLILIAYLLGSLVVQFAVGYSKYTVSDRVTADIKSNIRAIDANNQEQLAVLSLINQMSLASLVRSDAIDDAFLTPLNISSILESKQARLAALMHQPFKLVTDVERLVAAFRY